MIYFLLLICLFTQHVHGGSASDEVRDLKRKLFDEYSTDVLPSEQTTVEINKFVVKDFTMREPDHSVNVMFILGMSWRDPKLTWNPSEHQGISEIGTRGYNIWSPDLALKNTPNKWTQFLWNFDPIEVSSDGQVKYIPLHYGTFSCTFDMTYWPHDTHNCTMVMRSWSHGSENLDFDIKVTPEIDLRAKVGSTGETMKDWDVSDVKVSKAKTQYPCCKSPFIEIRFSMIFTRRAPAFGWNTKVPIVCLCLLTLGIFLLPPDAGEKFVLSGFIFFCNGLFLATTVQIIRASPSHTPLLIQMSAQQLVLTSIGIVVAVGVFRIAKTPHTTGIPLFLKGPTLGISRVLLLGNYTDLISSSHKSFTWTLQGDQIELADDSPAAIREKERCEWVLLGAVIDRLVLILYMVITLITFIRFSSVL